MDYDGVLRDVGPQDVDRAGELAKQVGVHHQGKRLIQAVARAKPAAVVAAQSRPEDRFRTMFLDNAEVQEKTVAAFGEDVVKRVIHGRVRGKGAEDERLVVVVLFETKDSGRTSRGVLKYEDFDTSRERFDNAVTSGAFDPFVDEEDPKEMRKELSNARRELRRLRGHVAGGQPGGQREAAIADPAAALDEDEATVAKLIPFLNDAGLREILNAEPSEKTRDAIQEELDKRAEDAANAAAGGGDFNAEAVLDGKVDEVTARLGNLSGDELNAVRDAEKSGKNRKTVLEAIKSARG